MSRRLLAAVAFALAAASAPAAQTEVVHTFEVRDGHVYLDGQHLPDAVPEGLDLAGLVTAPLEFSGPIKPVLEVDGVAYVLEDERLVPLDESSRSGRGVYILGDVTPDPQAASALPEERVTPILEAAYMRGVASRNEGLYDRMRQEVALEGEVQELAARVRALPAGPERARGRTELRRLLSDLLSLKHEIRAEEIAVAEQQLDAARRGLVDRHNHHDDIVDGRLRELVGDE